MSKDKNTNEHVIEVIIDNLSYLNESSTNPTNSLTTVLKEFSKIQLNTDSIIIKPISDTFTKFAKVETKALFSIVTNGESLKIISESYLETLRTSLTPIIDTINESIKENDSNYCSKETIMQIREFYSKESSLLSENTPQIHTLVTEIDNSLTEIEFGNASFPSELENAISDLSETEKKKSTGFKVLKDPDWYKEQICAFIFQAIFAIILSSLLGLIKSEQAQNFLTSILDWLNGK